MTSKIVATATVRAVKKRLLPMRAALVLTPAAVNKIKDIMSRNEGQGFVGLKVGVKQRGCNGLSYTLDFTKEKGKMDEEVKQDGVTVIIDKKAQLSLLGMWRIRSIIHPSIWYSTILLISGTEMDYVEDKLSSEFVFNNPNIKGTCGCGESFSIWECR